MKSKIFRARFFLLLLLILAGCSSAESPRDTQANCDDYRTMARGVVSCEQAGDRCEYSRDKVTGEASLVKLDSSDAVYQCTCDPNGVGLMLFWCKER